MHVVLAAAKGSGVQTSVLDAVFESSGVSLAGGEKMMRCLLVILVCFPGLISFGFARMTSPALSPSDAPGIWSMTPWGPTPAPAFSPTYHGSFASPPVPEHHKILPAVSPTPVTTAEVEECSGVSCSDPLTRTPMGSPCGCVFPMHVIIDVGIPPRELFSLVQELIVEVAAGTFLKQSQVQVTGAYSSNLAGEKTTVTIALVPLGERFDNMTALLIYNRFWQKKVPIKRSKFHGYEVIDIRYPGLPSSLPLSGGSSASGPTGTGSQQYPLTANVPTGNTHKAKARIISVVALASFILVLACLGIAIFVLKSKKVRRSRTAPGPVITPSVTGRSEIKNLSPSKATSSMSLSSTMVTCPPSVKTFSLAELEKATNGFDTKRVLGEGGFGRVYHGIMEDGSEVAAKLLTRKDQNRDREREFIAEVEMLSRLHHRNLVKLIGICIEGNMRCLVYELVRNGSVASHLHGVDKRRGNMDWGARLKIALGAARALAYLHEDSNPGVIHRDFKASNILLEEDFTPKVSDFGLAKEASDGTHHISTRVMGTFGYVAPEYAMTGHLIAKSDVYSYGVVLLELLSGRKPVYVSDLDRPESLVTGTRPLLASMEGLKQLIDPSLQGNYDIENVARVAAIASMCVHMEPSKRPFMGEVVQALKLICDGKEGGCEHPYSRKESSSVGVEYESNRDFSHESTWWSGASPPLAYGHTSFLNMEYSSDYIEEDMERPHSASGLVGRVEPLTGNNFSGPLKTKRQKQAIYRLRGTVSEHGRPSRYSHIDGF